MSCNQTQKLKEISEFLECPNPYLSETSIMAWSVQSYEFHVFVQLDCRNDLEKLLTIEVSSQLKFS